MQTCRIPQIDNGYLQVVVKMLNLAHTLLLIIVIVVPGQCSNCFNSISFTVYRDNDKKVVSQRAITVNDQYFATEIVIEGQLIPLVQAGCVKNLPELKYLKLIDCNIKDIEPSAFLNLPNLRTLKINFNHIAEIRNGVFASLNVVKLSLRANGITHIQRHAFYNLTYLEVLDISMNNLHFIRAETFCLTSNLRHVDFSFNKLGYVEDYFFKDIFSANPDNYTSLIDLSHNNISEVQKEAFRGICCINSLLLNDNNIERISPNMFKDIKYGASLNVRDNPIWNSIPFEIHEKFEKILYNENQSGENEYKK